MDIDADGDLDLMTANGSTTDTLYLNDGTGSFSTSTNILPGETGYSSVAVWADYDLDGDLDCFGKRQAKPSGSSELRRVHRDNRSRVM